MDVFFVINTIQYSLNLVIEIQCHLLYLHLSLWILILCLSQKRCIIYLQLSDKVWIPTTPVDMCHGSSKMQMRNPLINNKNDGKFFFFSFFFFLRKKKSFCIHLLFVGEKKPNCKPVRWNSEIETLKYTTGQEGWHCWAACISCMSFIPKHFRGCGDDYLHFWGGEKIWRKYETFIEKCWGVSFFLDGNWNK